MEDIKINYQVDPKGRVVKTKSGRFFKVGEQLKLSEVAAVTAFNTEIIIKEEVVDNASTE